MVALTWLADTFRAVGLRVVEEPDWKTRTLHPFSTFTPVGLVNHHTAPPVPYPVTKLYRKCNYTIAPDGTIYVVNAGWAAHAGYGDSKVLAAVKADTPAPKPSDTYTSTDPVTPGGANPGVLGNKWFIGVEVQHKGDGSQIPQAQRDALVVSNAAVCLAMGWAPATRLIGHREWTKRKIDPRWDGTANPMPGIRTDTELSTGELMGWKSDDGYDYLDSDEWGIFTGDVQWTINSGLMVGSRDKTSMTARFDQSRQMTRGETAAVLHRLAKDSPTLKAEVED